MIIKEIGVVGYTEYTCCLFKTYLTSIDAKFPRGFKDEQKEWMIDKHSATYCHTNLMDLALKLFYNQKSLGEWNPTMTKVTKPDESKEFKTNVEPKYLVLPTKQLQMLMTKVSKKEERSITMSSGTEEAELS
eukprot:10365465-Ditylum_brightwellii.AAC.1